MGSEWHYTQNRQPAATPIAIAELKQLAEQGLLRADDLVWQEGMSEWKPASVVLGLFPSRMGEQTEEITNLKRVPIGDPGANKSAASDDRPPLTPSSWLKSPHANQQGLHPFYVGLFSLATLGIFAIWYVVRCHRQLARGSQEIDATGRPLGKLRHPALVLLLGYLTLGYYNLYWISRVLEECADHLGRQDIQPRTEHGLMVCLPFYSLYLVLYKLPDLIREVRRSAGLPNRPDPGANLLANPFLILALPVLCSIYQGELNTCWSRAAC